MLLNQWIRVFFSDNGTVTDLSLALQSNDDVTLDFVSADDYLYVAQSIPFNNLFFEIGATANDQAATPAIELWDGVAWRAAVDVLDATSSSGVSLAQDGVIQYSPDRNQTWTLVDDTRDEPTAFGIASDVTLFDQYLARIRWSADLNAATTLRKVGYLFATGEQLDAIDPEINNYLASWESGKTDWVEQLLIGSQHVIMDLRARGWITHPGQIIRLDEVSLATAYRTLGIIYNKLGPGFDPQKEAAVLEYNNLMSVKRFTFDTNNDAEMDFGELANSVSRGVR